jgi:valyl-tRNA synthetase
MSKSKGNVVTPESLIPVHSADVLRYWASTSRLGADTAFAEEVLANGKRFVNKLWNSAKFVAGHFEGVANAQTSLITHPTDLWIIAKLNIVAAKVRSAFEEFEYCEARIAIEEFFWKDFCDNYLEIVKVRIYGEDKASAVNCLYYMFEVILKLFAPFVPYVTEEIYSLIYKKGESIHAKGGWPKMHIFNDYNPESDHLVTILDLVRKAKASNNLSIKAAIEYIEVKNCAIKDEAILQDLKNVVNALEILFVEEFIEEDCVIEGERIVVNVRFAS